MNKNKFIATTSLQAKTLNLKNYSKKIKILNSLAKDNASLRNQILAKARDNSVKEQAINPIRALAQESSYSSPSATAFPSIPALSVRTVLMEGQGKDGIGAIVGEKEIAASSVPTYEYKGRRAFIKTPLVRISSRLHRHIKSVWSTENFNEGEVANNNTIVYNFNNNFKKFKLTSILENSFFSMNRLISKPVLNIKPNKVIIQLFFYLSPSSSGFATCPMDPMDTMDPMDPMDPMDGVRFQSNPASPMDRIGGQAGIKLANLLKSKSLQLQALCAFLSKKFKKPVEFELIRLHHPSLESHILANTIGYIAKNTRKTFRVIMLKLFKSTKIKKFNEFKYIYNIRTFKPTALVGIKIKLGGRLLSQRIVPRFTSRTIQRGNLGQTKADFITTSRFTNKNKRGAFSFTVTMGHKFF